MVLHSVRPNKAIRLLAGIFFGRIINHGASHKGANYLFPYSRVMENIRRKFFCDFCNIRIHLCFLSVLL